MRWNTSFTVVPFSLTLNTIKSINQKVSWSEAILHFQDVDIQTTHNVIAVTF